jgi:Tol biopolymer transport system component
VPVELWNHILFKTTRNGPEEIFAVNPATNQLFRINDARIYALALQGIPRSPDGNQVALVEADNNRLLQIKIHSYEYNVTRQITAFGPTAQASEPASYDPAWSPRDDRIVFVTNNTGNDEIFTVDLQGQILTQLTYNRTEWDKHPSWSPDGAQIVFYSNRDVGLRRLWLMNADGSGQYSLSNLIQPDASNPDYEDWDPVWVR